MGKGALPMPPSIWRASAWNPGPLSFPTVLSLFPVLDLDFGGGCASGLCTDHSYFVGIVLVSVHSLVALLFLAFRRLFYFEFSQKQTQKEGLRCR